MIHIRRTSSFADGGCSACAAGNKGGPLIDPLIVYAVELRRKPDDQVTKVRLCIRCVGVLTASLDELIAEERKR